MAVGYKVRQAVLRDNSPSPHKELDLPILDRFKAELKMQRATTDLGIRRILHENRKSKIDHDWKTLAEEKEMLKELFLSSNKVIKDNKACISRLYEIIKEQKSQKVKLEQDIFSTQEDIDKCMKVKETLENYVKQFSIFEKFIERVALESEKGNLANARGIFDRYQALEKARLELARILGAELKAETQLRQQMVELMEEKSTELKGLANHLVMLQISGKKAHDSRIYWESIVQRVKDLIRAHKEEMVVLGGACWDLYNLICRRRRARLAVPAHDIQSQLDYIQKSIAFYKEVLTVATGMAETQRQSLNKGK